MGKESSFNYQGFVTARLANTTPANSAEIIYFPRGVTRGDCALLFINPGKDTASLIMLISWRDLTSGVFFFTNKTHWRVGYSASLFRCRFGLSSTKRLHELRKELSAVLNRILNDPRFRSCWRLLEAFWKVISAGN